MSPFVLSPLLSPSPIPKLDLKFRDSGDILDGTIQSGQKFKWLDMGEDEEVVARAKNRLMNMI